MSTENKYQFDTNWYELWMKQSKEFFESAQKSWFTNPQDHLKQIQSWLDTFKKQWEFAQLTEEQKKYQEYWKMMANMCTEASEMMTKEWIKRSHEENPVKDIRELYELWVDCCQNVYQKSLQSNAYQDTYNEFMNAAIKFWKSAMPMK